MKSDNFFDSQFHERDLEQSIAYIEAYFSDQEIKGKSVVDAGCGTGADTLAFGMKGAAEVIGVDNSGKSLEIAQGTAEKLSARSISFCKADISRFFQQQVFADLIFCQGVIIYVKNGLEIIDLISKRVNEGGILFFTVAADSYFARVLNKMRYFFSIMPNIFWDPIIIFMLWLIPILKKLWGESLVKNRGIQYEKSLKINLFLPFASLLSKRRIERILEENGMEIVKWEIQRTLNQDLFYLIKAIKRSKNI